MYQSLLAVALATISLSPLADDSAPFIGRIAPIDLPMCDDYAFIQHGQYQVVDQDGFTVSWNNTYHKALEASIKVRGGTITMPVIEVKCIMRNNQYVECPQTKSEK